jgi:hypothetical protein
MLDWKHWHTDCIYNNRELEAGPQSGASEEESYSRGSTTADNSHKPFGRRQEMPEKKCSVGFMLEPSEYELWKAWARKHNRSLAGIIKITIHDLACKELTPVDPRTSEGLEEL